jgi:hypothetical protein
VPKSSMADLGKTRETISSVVSEVGEGNLSSAEKRLYELSTNPKTTYGALLREKNQIGSALKSAAGNNPYGSVETGTLKRLYGALADDQLSTVEKAVGGEAGAALRQDLHYANRLTAQRKALEKRIVNAFGKEGEGSIASKLVSAIKSGAKGDVTGLNKVLKAVPKDLHKETIVTALMNSARTPQGNFSPNAFANLYQGIRGNAPVAKTVFGTLSKEENETLRSIYTIAKRTRDAENAVSKTGKANQPLYDALIAQNAIGALLDSAAGKMAQNAVGAIPSGGAARALTSKVAEALTTTPAERLTAVNSLLNSPQFSDLLEAASKAGSGEAPDRVVKGLARSKVFSDFAKSVNMSRDMTDRERFIAAMLQGSKGAVTEDKQKGKF